MRRYLHTTIKMTFALVITTIIAQALNMEYAITAGILAVLFIQPTRQDSYMNALKRIAGGLLAIGLSTVFFVVLGYHIWVFFLLAFFFIASSFALRISVGIVPSLVLVSHLLIEGAFTWSMLVNAILLIGVSAIVAMVLNAAYPLNTYKYLSGYINRIDELLKRDVVLAAEALSALERKEQYLKRHTENREQLVRVLREAELTDKDLLFDKNHRHMAYLRMRHAQMKRVERLFDLMQKLEKHHPYADILANYIQELAEDIGKTDKATPQLEKLHALRESFRKKPLPENREAFETRAILFQTMFEIESFLQEKIRFHQNHPTLQ